MPISKDDFTTWTMDGRAWRGLQRMARQDRGLGLYVGRRTMWVTNGHLLYVHSAWSRARDHIREDMEQGIVSIPIWAHKARVSETVTVDASTGELTIAGMSTTYEPGKDPIYVPTDDPRWMRKSPPAHVVIPERAAPKTSHVGVMLVTVETAFRAIGEIANNPTEDACLQITGNELDPIVLHNGCMTCMIMPAKIA